MDRPIFAEPVTGFADYFEAAASVIARVLNAVPDVAEPLSIAITTAGLTAQPWQVGAPVTALLSWADHMTDLVWTATVHPPHRDDQPRWCSIRCQGRLYGLPTDLHGSCWRVPHQIDASRTGPQPLTDATVLDLAISEAKR